MYNNMFSKIKLCRFGIHTKKIDEFYPNSDIGWRKCKCGFKVPIKRLKGRVVIDKFVSWQSVHPNNENSGSVG